MTDDNVEAKLEFIETSFRDLEQRLKRIRELVQLGYVEEAIILACCAIDSIASIRYSEDYATQKDFIHLISQYSGHQAEFAKISWIFLYKNGKDPSETTSPGKPLAGYNQIKPALLELYGKESNHHQELDKRGIIDYLKGKKLSLDWHNLEANLDKFSYSAVLYEKYRSRGVHKRSIATKWSTEGKPLFEKNSDGEDIYYDGNILYFSKEIILEVLENIIQNLKVECIPQVLFPWEL